MPPPVRVVTGVTRTPPGAIPIGTRVRIHDSAVSRYAGESGEILGGWSTDQINFTYTVRLDGGTEVMIPGSQVYAIVPPGEPDVATPAAHRLLMMGMVEELMSDVNDSDDLNLLGELNAPDAHFHPGEMVRARPGALSASGEGVPSDADATIVSRSLNDAGTVWQYRLKYPNGTYRVLAESDIYRVPGTKHIRGALIARDVNGKVVFEIMPNGVKALLETQQTLIMRDEDGKQFMVKVEILGGALPDEPKPVPGGKRKLKL